jgi:anaerobic selenocysteine-containing dehydrogenase/Fe-S-cluster-containing hydrogenase component 2
MTKKQKRFGMLIDLHRCTGCYACQVTCKAEYDIPLGTFRCRVETYQSGNYPHIIKFFLPRLCNHCDNAPCIEACEEKALYKNQDGVVIIDNDMCTGCQACYEKCPYSAIETNRCTGKAEKCDFCYTKRILNDRLPVCVESCMGKAFLFGDLNDKGSEISRALETGRRKVLNPELGTNPSVYYLFDGNVTGSPLSGYEITKGHSTVRTSAEHPPEKTFRSSRLIYTSDAMCPSECGISVLVENGIARKIYGNPHTLVNKGAFCSKGAAGLQLTYSPYRIKTPLMRTGERGEDRWKEITWDEAVDHITKKLIEIKQAYGPEAVFFDGGDVTDREAYERLFRAFGTPNTYNHGSICDPNRKWGQRIMTGDERPLPDIQRPVLMRNRSNEMELVKKHDIKLVLNIGVNPFVATRFNYMSYGIPAARKENNCTYIVVDPAHTNSAAHADIWLPIRPGTDAALLAGMFYYIIQNDSPDNPSRKFIDHGFLEKYAVGWEDFKNAFLSYVEQKDPSNDLFYFTLKWAEEKTGIPEKEIERVSQLFGITKPASIEIGMHGTAHHTNGDVTSVLMTALCLVTGNVDKQGGLVFIDSQKVKRNGITAGEGFLEQTVKREINNRVVSGKLSELHKDLYGDYPAAWKGVLADLPRKIREGVTIKHGPFQGYRYPVKAFVARAGNPVITAGNTTDWIDAVTSRSDDGSYLLDLMVFVDTHITVTGKYADIILPEAGFLERMGLSDVHTMSPEVSIRERVIEPLYKSKTPYGLMIALSEALIRKGDPDIKAGDFKDKYSTEEDFVNELLAQAPGFYNVGKPLPYPELPAGALIVGTPDNPSAIIDGNVIKQGEQLTVDWLRRHHGVAIWPASYERYKKSDDSLSGVYPRTGSKKFEFRFSYLENINKRFGTDFPITFYWSENKWNPKSQSYKKLRAEYPFQLISGRTHYAMTMTVVCPYLSETDTECMKPLNNEFRFSSPAQKETPVQYGILPGMDVTFHKDTVSIPVFAFNHRDGERLGINTGDEVILENPLKRSVRGKTFLTEEIMPGVIKTAFGTGGQKASGTGFLSSMSDYTPNINELHDPENLSSYTGMPGFGDIMVKVSKVKSSEEGKR